MDTSDRFDRWNSDDRMKAAQRVAAQVLGMGGMEEDAAWSRYRVLYIPEWEYGRVCVCTGVPVGSSWVDGIAHEVSAIRLTYRVRRDDMDRIVDTRDVRLTGTFDSIIARLRKGVLEGRGIVAAHRPS